MERTIKNLLALSIVVVVLTSGMSVFAAPQVVEKGQPYFFETYFDNWNGELDKFTAAVVFNDGVKTKTDAPAGYSWQSLGLVVDYTDIGYQFGWYGFNFSTTTNSPNGEPWVLTYSNEEENYWYSEYSSGIWFNGVYYPDCKFIITRNITYGGDFANAVDSTNYEILLPTGYTDASYTFYQQIFNPQTETFDNDEASALVVTYK